MANNFGFDHWPNRTTHKNFSPRFKSISVIFGPFLHFSHLRIVVHFVLDPVSVWSQTNAESYKNVFKQKCFLNNMVVGHNEIM